MLWLSAVLAGAWIQVWAYTSLPAGTSMAAVPLRGPRSRLGPYRFCKHPMYWGNCIFFAGLGGIAGGFWNALALCWLAYMVCSEWALRERLQ